MALSKSIPTPYGEATYHIIQVVTSQHLPYRMTRIVVHSFRDEAHRAQPGAQPLRVSEDLLVGDDVLHDEANQWPAAYARLKTFNPDFGDAEDA